MTYHIVALPREKELRLLNELRSYIYQNNFLLRNRSLSSSTHITLTEVEIENTEELEKELQKNSKLLKAFSIDENQWVLTKEDQEPNYKVDKPYTWIALRFPQRKEIYTKLDEITKGLGINRNERYIQKVKKIQENLKDEDCIANHMNLANYTKREKANECWEYFNKKLPKEIPFDRIALRDLKGNLIFKTELT
jgi:hypothetical protein